MEEKTGEVMVEVMMVEVMMVEVDDGRGLLLQAVWVGVTTHWVRLGGMGKAWIATSSFGILLYKG